MDQMDEAEFARIFRRARMLSPDGRASSASPMGRSGGEPAGTEQLQSGFDECLQPIGASR